MGAELVERRIIHIGPPKTGTTALQETVIPHLGLPFQSKPDWMKALIAAPEFAPPATRPDGVIFSDENLGGFFHFPPDMIAQRLAAVFGSALVLFVRRDPVELFYSLFRQALINTVGFVKKAAPVYRTGKPEDANGFFDKQIAQFQKMHCGFFAIIDADAVRTAFEKHFELQLLDFALLKSDPAGFVARFADACGSSARPILGKVHQSERATMEKVLATLPLDTPAYVRSSYLETYENGRLSPDREDYLLNWPRSGR